MDPREISDQLSRIANTLSNTETIVNRLAKDSEELELRIVSIEKQIEVSSTTMKGFWERDWGNMMSEIKSINEKMQLQMSLASQTKSETALLEQKVGLTFKAYDEKLARMDKDIEQGKLALWKLVGAGGTSGAALAGIIALFEHFLKVP